MGFSMKRDGQVMVDGGSTATRMMVTASHDRDLQDKLLP
jgi:hypothetical protein